MAPWNRLPPAREREQKLDGARQAFSNVFAVAQGQHPGS
jgi:hypothetical protein